MTDDSRPRRVLRAVVLGAALAFAAGCSSDDVPDAYGTFEATETTVSAQAEGRLLTFAVDEGDVLAPGAVVGLVDTTQLAAQRSALLAQRRQLLGQKRSLLAQAQASLASRDAALATGTATLAGVAEAEAGAAALAAQLQTAREELARTRRLADADAATARELNERQGQVAALAQTLAQAQARAASIRAQAQTSGAQARVQSVQAGVPQAQAAALDDQVAGLDAQLEGLAARVANAAVTNPIGGTVLSVIAEPGETVATGSPLYTVADLSSLRLRAYATGDQLARIRLGQPAAVFVDDGSGGVREMRGTVTFVAADAQFTPTPIQTRDARAELVYAVDIRVPNPDGWLKVGMPGDVRFLDGAAGDDRAPADTTRIAP